MISELGDDNSSRFVVSSQTGLLASCPLLIKNVHIYDFRAGQRFGPDNFFRFYHVQNRHSTVLHKYLREFRRGVK